MEIVFTMQEEYLIDELKAKWQNCENNHVDVFRYKLNVAGEKVLDGDFKFLVQVFYLFMKTRDVTNNFLIVAK